MARLLVGLAFVVSVPLGAQPPVDSALAAYIAGVKAIDNHAHPLLPGRPDSEYDALPLVSIPAFPLPVRLRADSPTWIAAWHALYGYAYDDTLHLRDVMDAKRRVASAQREHAAEWALDRMGTEVMIANRVAMGPGLGPPRFRWVPFDDALLLPLNTAREAASSPDRRSLYPREERLLRRYLADLGVATLPATLDAYLTRVVTPTLERQRHAGAVAIKFEAAYLRSLEFGNPSRDAARAVYARGGTPPRADYKTLEDFLFRYVAREAGRLGLAVHIHCNELAGGFYQVGGSDPLLLESVFNDSTLRGTNFVLLHGGWPYTRHTLSMLGKPNAYADMSLMVQFLSPHTVSGVLREWLDEYPEKVLYGSDAFADHDEDPAGWPEAGWIAATTARSALGLALTGMMRDGDITPQRARQIAYMVLRGNAAALYKLDANSASTGLDHK